jgi:Fe-S cluster assembly iron-binding protein IscA
VIQVSDRAKSELESLLRDNEGKSLRVLFKGYG